MNQLIGICQALREKLGLSVLPKNQLPLNNGCEKFCHRIINSEVLINNCGRGLMKIFFQGLLSELKAIEGKSFELGLSSPALNLVKAFKRVVESEFEAVAFVDWGSFNQMDLSMNIKGKTPEELAVNLQKALMISGWQGEVTLWEKNIVLLFQIDQDCLVFKGAKEETDDFEAWCKIHRKIAPFMQEWLLKER